MSVVSCQNPLGNNLETYFVEPEVQQLKRDFRRELQHMSLVMSARNAALGPFAAYESLLPNKIPNSKYPLASTMCIFIIRCGTAKTVEQQSFRTDVDARETKQYPLSTCMHEDIHSSAHTG